MINRLLSILKIATIVVICTGVNYLKGETLHWFEAEKYKGNVAIINDKTCSSGKCLKGRTWYNFIKNVPFPQSESKKLNCWIRVKSDVPSHWYLWDSKNKKVKSWFKSIKPDTWQWINLGRYSAKSLSANQNKLWNIFLRTPIEKKIPTATGWIDVVVFTDINSPQKLTELFREKNYSKKKTVTAASGKKLAALKKIRRITECPYFKNAPVIDGELDDSCWMNASVLDKFILLGGKGFPSEQTEVKIGYDKNKLYIAAVLKESKIKFLRKIQNIRNQEVWTDDSFEIFIDTELKQHNAAHFIVNPIGTRQDNLNEKIDEVNFSRNISLDWNAATKIKKDRWLVEIAIPWKLITHNTPSKGTAAGFNVCRSERPQNETSYWNNTGGYFNRPANFGLLLFGEFPIKLTGLKISPENKKVKFYISSASTNKTAIKTILKKHKNIIAQQSTLISSSGVKTIEQPLPLSKSGTYCLNVNVECHKKILCSFSLPFKTYSKGLVSVAWPAEERNDTLHLLGNTVQHCFFLFANHSEETIKAPCFEICVPDGINILSPEKSVLTTANRYYPTSKPEIIKTRIKGQNYFKYVYKLKRQIHPGRIEKKRFFNGLMLFFQTSGKNLYNKSYPVYYALRAGKKIEEPKAFILKVLAPTKGRQPRKIVIHNWLWTINPGPYNWSQYVDTLKKVGFNSVDAATVQKQTTYIDQLRKYNITVFNNFWWHWQYPDYTRNNQQNPAVKYNGKIDKSKICPTILLQNDGELIKSMFKSRFNLIEKNIADGFIWDLEGPFCWDMCFCKNCLNAFKNSIGIPEKETITPKSIKNKYARQWISFCCNQSAKICGIIRNKIKIINPKAGFGFYSATPSFTTCERYRVDWGTASRNIDWALPSYYSNSASDLNINFNSGMKRVINEIRKAAAHPIKIIATLTPGYGRNTSVNPSAELVKMQVLRSIASGMDGVSFWWWGPFDGLYYQKMAEATDIISRFEGFFLTGKDTDKIRITHHYGNSVSSFIKERNGLVLVILFNHNEHKKCNFTLHKKPYLNGIEYPSGQKSCEQITVSPLNVKVFLFGKGNLAVQN